MASNADLVAKWSSLLPKLRDRWPKVTGEEWQEINGDLELLLKKVGERYPALSRTDILSELTTLMERPEVVEE